MYLGFDFIYYQLFFWGHTSWLWNFEDLECLVPENYFDGRHIIRYEKKRVQIGEDKKFSVTEAQNRDKEKTTNKLKQTLNIFRR